MRETRETDFLESVTTTIFDCGSEDLVRTREIIEETGEEIYDDFLNELKESKEFLIYSTIDPVAIVYGIILNKARQELDEIISNIVLIEQDKNELINEYEHTIEKVCVYGNFLDTRFDSYSELSDFLKKIGIKNYLNRMTVSRTLEFFLKKII